ncbi:MAG: pilus assembly protein TadG-related protein [Chloroflexota bacterium]|nr:pilus assembly protein TadG-related protein [Chloroflexota bacterium]
MRAVKGQALLLLVVTLPLLLSIVGLVIDGGVVFDARRELQNMADGAARVGAMQVDVDEYRRSNGKTVVLVEKEAETASRQYLEAEARQVTGLVQASPQGVRVQAGREVQLSFLSLVGFDTVTVQATAVAEVHHDIERDQFAGEGE